MRVVRLRQISGVAAHGSARLPVCLSALSAWLAGLLGSYARSTEMLFLVVPPSYARKSNLAELLR